MRRYALAILVGLAALGQASAQAPGWQFRWQVGQALHYRVEHVTTVSEVTGSGKVETANKLSLVKRWQVLAVDAQGIATLQFSLASMRTEQTRPSGEVLLFDSANLEKSTPQLREQMAKYVGQTLAILRVDPYGRVVEVKQGDPKRYENELPFQMVLPAGVPAAGQGWERPFKIKVEPTGEEHEAVQKFACVKADASAGVVRVTTALKNPPPGPTEQVPLLQKQAEGEVVFDVQSGRLHSARLVIDKEILGHQGEGSRYQFRSNYTEQYQAP